ncbi:SusC/RagA family TonB-linked outer membrane protein [Pedobacter frigidisoli]|uniref:SusC/RagA family TonB-linked outer membrane protein n=1 Tax=Pedobacter frigidisoli TaxID=2530455 RepID=A0A4R0P936_9SPHI|nr:SusC/RagA family TonB-linked outer membrane protein [Pedobacter frigidisoli]TCD12517.1 SusC/RagA family TonB-linked outer membrane protein [Pedobacter frigidisoli]
MERNFYKRNAVLSWGRMAMLMCAIFWSVLAKADAQQANSQPERLENYLKKIEQAYKLSFVYDASEISKTMILDVPSKLTSVQASLEQLKQKNISYTRVGSQVVLKINTSSTTARDVIVKGRVRDKKDNSTMPGVSIREKGAANAVSTNSVGEYQIKVKDGATLVFSSIGYKTIEVAVNGKTTIDISIEEDANQLKEVNVVSTGYQQLDRKLFTGSSTLVKAEDSQRNGVPDISRMLEGQVAGVSVQNVSGTFGAAPKIRVRGATSITGDNKPLWVVDGIILEDLVNISNDALSTGDANTLVGSSVAGLNPDDIESFNILKDAAATAMYGARAMNGVIVVTTKKGKNTEGTPRISYTGNFTTYLKPSYDNFDILNSADQMSVLIELENKGYFQHTTASRGSEGGAFYKMYNSLYDYNPSNDSFALRNDISSRNNFLQRYANANTDWFDVLFKNSLLQEHSMSINSGTEKFQTYASTSYLHDSGQTVGNSVDRFTGNFRANFKMSSKLSAEILMNGSVRDQRAPGTQERTSDPVYGKFSRDFDINPYSYALNTSRTMTAFDENGNREFFTRNYSPFNILHEIDNNYLTLGNIDFKVQGGIKYKIIPSLTYSVDGAYRFAKTERQHYILENANMVLAYRNTSDATTIGSNKFLYTDPANPYGLPESVLPEGGFYNTTTDNLKSYYFRQNLEFDKTFATDHRLNVFGSMEVRFADRQAENFDGVGYQYENGGIVNSAYKYFKWAQESGFPYFGMSNGYDRFSAFALRAAYSYKEKYSFNATTRYDGSNLMGKSRTARWLPTWNISGAWNIDQESFWPKNDIFSSARVRATYGLTANLGNANNSAAVFYNQITRRPYDNEKETATFISGLENSELTWEKTKELNLGADLTFLKDRINVTFDIYRKNIFDLIGNIKTSGIGGQFNKVANYADMTSKGIEFTVAGNAINNTDFRWRTQFNVAFNKNEITNLEVNPSIFTLVSADGGALLGHAQRGLYSIQFDGLDHDRGFPYYIDEAGKRSSYVNLQSNDISYLKYEGPNDPTFYGGFYNQFRYKNFSLSALLTFAAGNFVRLDATYQASYSDIYSMSKDMLNRWIMPGDEKFTNIPALLDPFDASQTIKDADGSTISARYPYNLYNFSTERVAKGDYIRFKQISLGYDVPKKITSKLHMANATISLIGNNLALLYSDKNLNGQDPEFFGSGGVALPIPKQYTLSLKVGF